MLGATGTLVIVNITAVRIGNIRIVDDSHHAYLSQIESDISKLFLRDITEKSNDHETQKIVNYRSLYNAKNIFKTYVPVRRI